MAAYVDATTAAGAFKRRRYWEGVTDARAGREPRRKNRHYRMGFREGKPC